MQTEQVRAHFLSRFEIIEDFPFGIKPTVLVRLKRKNASIHLGKEKFNAYEFKM